MIERLIRSLRDLAAPAAVQLAVRPDFAVQGDELALEFADALLLASDCPQLRLDGGQRDGLFALDDLLERMRGRENAALWTAEAVAGAPAWDEVRMRARAALRSLDLDAPLHPDAEPPG